MTLIDRRRRLKDFLNNMIAATLILNLVAGTILLVNWML
jgi:hypothetical protein